MIVVYDDDIWVHYGFLWLQASDADFVELIDARGGQVNGLAGVAFPGVLSLLTGLHTGEVRLRIEAHDGPPPDPGGEWEEVVEASVAFDESSLVLSAFQDFVDVDLPAAGSYRVRYCASGMDEANQLDTRMEDDPAPDRYLLQLWPAPPAPDAVVRETSGNAKYWHGVARETRRPG